MFGLLRLAMTLVIIVMVVGLYLGWFSFSQAQPDPQTNRVNINVSVDKHKMGADLQNFEQKVARGIQNINKQPPANGAVPLQGQQAATPGLSVGPVSLQPSAPPEGQPNGQPAWSLGGFSVQPQSQPAAPAGYAPAGPPQLRVQTQDFQFNVPLGVPSGGGEGR